MCVGRFCDEDGNVHQADTERIAQWQITLGCSVADPTCSAQVPHITRRQMASVPVQGGVAALDHPGPRPAQLSDAADNAWFRTFADRVIPADAFAAPGGVFDPGG